MSGAASGPLPGMEYRRLEIAGADYLVALGGDGPPALLLHGLGQSRQSWGGTAAGSPNRAGGRTSSTCATQMAMTSRPTSAC